MASLHSPALRRRLDALTETVRRRVEHREKMREYARASASIRAALTEAGIDPAQNDGFRNFASGEHEVARWPDTPELQQADAAFIAQDPKLSSRQSLADEIAERAKRARVNLGRHALGIGLEPYPFHGPPRCNRGSRPGDIIA